jgi:Glycosyltransferase family 87
MNLRRAAPYVLLALCALALAPLVAMWWAQPIAAFFGRRDLWWDAEDFSVFYTAGHLVASGDGHLLYARSAFGAEQGTLPARHAATLNFFNPAFFALLFAPFSSLSFARAFQLWTLLNLGLLAVSCRLIWEIADPLERRWRVLIVMALVTFYPVTFALRLGQFSLILVTAWCGAFLLLRAGRDRAAGAALAVLLIKPELLVPIGIYLVLKRRPATLATFVPLALAAVAASVAITGMSEAARYPDYIRESALAADGNMYGWNGILAASISPYLPGTMTTPAMLLSALTLTCTGMVWWRSGAGRESMAPDWALIALAAMLIDGHFYLQDTVLLAPGAVALIAAARGFERSAVAAAAAAAWLILALGSQPSQTWHVNVFGIYAVLATVAVLFRGMRATSAMTQLAIEGQPEPARAA